MSTDFKFYGILCCTPAALDSERLLFEAAVTQFVEQVSMPDGVLFAPASLRPPINAAAQKAVIDSNIRTCEFFLQIFGEQWPDPVFAGFAEYAVECAADPSTATRKVGVRFRNYNAAAPELHRFRERLAAGGQCDLRDFGDPGELSKQLADLLSAWYLPLKPPTVERPFRLP